METVTVSALGAIVGLVLSIVFIFMKISPVYSLMLGSFIGGIVGGATMGQTISIMVGGAAGMMTTILRILAAGILAGVLINSGAADKIARTVIDALGEKRALLALSISTMILTSVGVFIDIAVITVAPIAMAVAKQAGFSKKGILLAMVGGGKCGNMMSPNPNAIAISSAFELPLTTVMMTGILPAAVALIVVYILSNMVKNQGSDVTDKDLATSVSAENLPSFAASITGPVVAILALALRPLFDITIDPMIALPLGGIIGALVMGKAKDILDYSNKGLNSMTGVAIILIGTGTIAGIIQGSELGDVIINTVQGFGIPMYLLAPIAGILMSAATASTTSGSTVAAQVFGPTLISAGVSRTAAASMIHCGATVLDHLPHGSFYHATGGSVNMEFKERLSLVMYDSLVGLTLTAASVVFYGIIGIF
ncbi:MAG: SLC13 family permease [Bacillota bacterium]|jgi:GntP family gluconate:H+ symporter|nr:SLC13 family permease [Bacillota bacterium]NLP22385.1 GntP family permease [Erysipelotrichaceae bacterium]